MTRPAWSAKRRPKRTAVSCSSVPDGIPDDVWREIMAEDKPDDETCPAQQAAILMPTPKKMPGPRH